MAFDLRGSDLYRTIKEAPQDQCRAVIFGVVATEEVENCPQAQKPALMSKIGTRLLQ